MKGLFEFCCRRHLILFREKYQSTELYMILKRQKETVYVGQLPKRLRKQQVLPVWLAPSMLRVAGSIHVACGQLHPCCVWLAPSMLCVAGSIHFAYGWLHPCCVWLTILSSAVRLSYDEVSYGTSLCKHLLFLSKGLTGCGEFVTLMCPEIHHFEILRHIEQIPLSTCTVHCCESPGDAVNW